MSQLTVADVGVELLDNPGADPRLVTRSLRNIARSNRWFGGHAALRFGLGRVLAGIDPHTELTLLDIGCGLGDLPRAAVRWGRRRGIRIVPLGLERSPVAARLARANGVPTVLADAGQSPVRHKGVDLVVLSQVAHHFDAASVVRLFRSCDRIARHAVIVADLRRSPGAVAAFRLGGGLLRFDRVTLGDGITSIRRGFTGTELAHLLAEADVRAEVARRPGYRLVATWRPGDS